MASPSSSTIRGREARRFCGEHSKPQYRSQSRRISKGRLVIPPTGKPFEKRAIPKGPSVGNMQIGQAVRVFSRSVEEWLDGVITSIIDDDFVRVDYWIGEELYGKTLHVLSEHLASIMIEGATEDHDPEGIVDNIRSFFKEVKRLSAGELLLGKTVERGRCEDNYIDADDPNTRWKRLGNQSSVVVHDLKPAIVHEIASCNVAVRLSKDLEVDEDLTKRVEGVIKSADGRELVKKASLFLSAVADVQSLTADGAIEAGISSGMGQGAGVLSFELSVPLVRLALKQHDPPADPAPYVSEVIMGCRSEGIISAHGSYSLQATAGIQAQARPTKAKLKMGGCASRRKDPSGYNVVMKTLGGPQIRMVHADEKMENVLVYLQKHWLQKARQMPETWRVLWVRVSINNRGIERGLQCYYSHSNIIKAWDWSSDDFKRNLMEMEADAPSGRCLVGHLTSKAALDSIIGLGRYGLRISNPITTQACGDTPSELRISKPITTSGFLFVIHNVSMLGWEQYGRHPFPERAAKALWFSKWRSHLAGYPEASKLQRLIVCQVPEEWLQPAEQWTHIRSISSRHLELYADGKTYLPQDRILKVYDLEPPEELQEPSRTRYRERLQHQPAIHACDWPFLDLPDRMEKIIFIGNPGVGKSTLLNGLAGLDGHGRVHFKSGVSYGEGLTSCMQCLPIRGQCLIDVPGLADAKKRQDAAKEIGQAFKQGGYFKVVFVALLDAGRMRADDKATMSVILEAIPDLKSFAIVFNKLSSRVKSELEARGEAWTRLQASLGNDNQMPVDDQIYFYRHDADLHDVDDAVPMLPLEFHNFIFRVIGNEVDASRVNSIDVDKFAKRVEELETTLCEVMADRKKYQAALAAAKEQQERMEQHHEAIQQEAQASFDADMKKLREESDKKNQSLEAELQRIRNEMNEEIRQAQIAFASRIRELEQKIKEQPELDANEALNQMRHNHNTEVADIREHKKKEEMSALELYYLKKEEEMSELELYYLHGMDCR